MPSIDSAAAVPAAGRPASGRIAFLDGLRGVAILLVVLFHAYARWPEFYPYGDRFVGNPFVDTRVDGVLLFFVISGFVILMSLEASAGFFGFLYRRWLRLFPAMLVASIVVYGLAHLIDGWPRGRVEPVNLLPGLTLLGEDVWMRLTGRSWEAVASLEGAFWSLYVETRFYLIFGALYFLIGRGRAVWALVGLYLLMHLFRVVEAPAFVAHLPAGLAGLAAGLGALHGHGILRALGVPYFLWFFVGANYWLWWSERRPHHYWIAVVASIVCALSPLAGAGQRLVIVALLAAVMRFEAVRRVVACRTLLVVGFASYPLYLIHENMMVAMIMRVGRVLPWLPAWTMPLVPIAVVIGLGWLFARFVEPPARRTIDRLVRGVTRPLIRRPA
jgi:peptidoglycan/LPS O-acetylase OafA/YrhL